MTPIAKTCSDQESMRRNQCSPYRADYVEDEEKVDVEGSEARLAESRNSKEVHLTMPVALVVRHSIIPRIRHSESRIVIRNTTEERKKCTNRVLCILAALLGVILFIAIAFNTVKQQE